VRIEVRLYATFAKFGPTQRAGNPLDVKLEDSASLMDLIHKLEIPEEDVHLSIVNGRIIHDSMQTLQNGDRVGLFPPIGGG